MRRFLTIMVACFLAAPVIAQGAREQAPVHRAGPLSVRLWFDPPVGAVVDSFLLYVETEIDDGWTVESPLFSLALGDTLGSLTVASISPSATVRVSENRFRRSRTIELTPDVPGAEAVGPFAFSARNILTGESVSLHTEPVEVEIQSLLAEVTDDFEPAVVRGPLAPAKAEETSIPPIVVSGLIGGGIALLIALYVILRRRPRPETIAGAIARLEGSASALSREGLGAREAAARADALVRELLAIDIEPGAHSMTPQEIVSSLLEHKAPKDVNVAVTAFFSQIERVLFAGDDAIPSERICECADDAMRALAEHTRRGIAA